MLLRLLVFTLFITGGQSAPTSTQEKWLKTFEGSWGLDSPVPSDADVIVNITREGKVLVLTAIIRGHEMVTRYNLSGADIANQTLDRKAIFRTRIEGKKLVTSIWDGTQVTGAPARIETRYLESPDLIVTELVKTPGGKPFHRGLLRRKGK